MARPRDKRLFMLLVVVVLAALTACSGSRARPPAMMLEQGAVAAAYPLAREIGRQVLEQGGNAVDAAVAAHFALAVCFPNAGNLGGGGFMLIHLPDGSVEALDYRETAPAAAQETLFQDAAGEVVEGLSLHSHLAAGVPGSVRGMWEAHRRHGSRPWRELLEPAIELAEALGNKIAANMVMLGALSALTETVSKEALKKAKQLIEKSVELNPGFEKAAKSELDRYQRRLKGIDALKEKITACKVVYNKWFEPTITLKEILQKYAKLFLYFSA